MKHLHILVILIFPPGCMDISGMQGCTAELGHCDAYVLQDKTNTGRAECEATATLNQTDTLE